MSDNDVLGQHLRQNLSFPLTSSTQDVGTLLNIGVEVEMFSMGLREAWIKGMVKPDSWVVVPNSSSCWWGGMEPMQLLGTYNKMERLNGERCSCSCSDLDKPFLVLYMAKPSKTKGAAKSFTDLKKLVIDDKTKQEIISVLRQHEYSEKLFTKWGLGEVFEYGKGMTMLFHGPPGTGKTWAATCIAKALGQKLLMVGAAEIQTSEPGGANRNIQNAFASAKQEKKVLFFDECDSLITNRSHVGMILGSEINTLLTEIEQFEGVCILATNRVDTLDEALERRLALIVNFPKPNAEQRLQIWKTLLPKKLPLSREVTIERLAEFNLTGGQIKNAILNAARSAISQRKRKVEFHHFQLAIARIQEGTGLMGKESGIFRALNAPNKAKVRDVTSDIVRL